MTYFAFKEKITKKKFNGKLITDFGYENIYMTPYSENHVDEDGCPYVKKMTLYYTNDDKHIATWMKGKGWIFESAYEK